VIHVWDYVFFVQKKERRLGSRSLDHRSEGVGVGVGVSVRMNPSYSL
jgi:hypothetical protein